jgi:hypothetical protein
MPVFAVIPAETGTPIAVFVALADARAWAAAHYGQGGFTIASVNLAPVQRVDRDGAGAI